MGEMKKTQTEMMLKMGKQQTNKKKKTSVESLSNKMDHVKDREGWI